MSGLGRRKFLARAARGAIFVGAGLAPHRYSQAATPWPDERRAGVFCCHADFSLQPHGNLWRELAQLQQDLSSKLRVPPALEPIHLFLFEHEATYRDYLRQHFPEVPYRRALFIKDSGPGMVFARRSDEFATDIRHESTHALLHATLPVVPLWLDEGLAEYFEMPPLDRALGSPHLRTVKWNAAFGQTPKLETLEAIGGLASMGATEYRQAWAWVHFMLHGPAAANDELVSFLGALHAQAPPGTMSQRLRRQMPDLEQRYRQHFRNWR